MSSGSVNSILSQFTRAMNRAQSPDDLKKVYRRGQFELHPNKHGGNSSFTNAFQRLQKEFEKREGWLRTGRRTNTNSNNSNNNVRSNANYRPRQRGSTSWESGRTYRSNTRYAPGNAKGFRTAGPGIKNNIAYARIKKTNPVIFQREVLQKLPLKRQPCEPGYMRRAPKYAKCKRDAREAYKKQYIEFYKDFMRWGVPVGFVASDWGRRRAATVLRDYDDAALIKKAAALGFDVFGI